MNECFSKYKNSDDFLVYNKCKRKASTLKDADNSRSGVTRGGHARTMPGHRQVLSGHEGKINLNSFH